MSQAYASPEFLTALKRIWSSTAFAGMIGHKQGRQMCLES